MKGELQVLSAGVPVSLYIQDACLDGGRAGVDSFANSKVGLYICISRTAQADDT